MEKTKNVRNENISELIESLYAHLRELEYSEATIVTNKSILISAMNSPAKNMTAPTNLTPSLRIKINFVIWKKHKALGWKLTKPSYTARLNSSGNC